VFGYGKAPTRTFGILPFGEQSTIHAAATSSTPAGGVLSDLSSPSAFLSKLFSAASAAMMIGSAAFKSVSHSS